MLKLGFKQECRLAGQASSRRKKIHSRNIKRASCSKQEGPGRGPGPVQGLLASWSRVEPIEPRDGVAQKVAETQEEEANLAKENDKIIARTIAPNLARI